MISHRCEFEIRELLRWLGWPLACVAAFAVLIRLGVVLGWLPPPRPTLDVDRTLLIHQLEAARAPAEADLLLLGDSSCLMDVSARQLGEALGARVLNLGTHSYLDLEAGARLLREYLAAHSRKPRAVLVLMHPEALRRSTPEAYHQALFQSLIEGRNPPALCWRDRFVRLLGLEDFRSRLLCRLVPTPLPGAYGRAYGFSREFERALSANLGSLLDPDTAPFQGNAEYRLAPQIESSSRKLRAAAEGVTLLAGITPVPEGFAARDYRQTRDAMLAQWRAWLDAAGVLSELPATLPDEQFARVTHLREAGVRAYTETLARVLKPHLPAP